MAANFPEAGNAIPGTYVDVETLARGASVPSGTRTMTIVGEGLREETLVSSALGGGLDGLNSSYSSTTGSDSRHFRTSVYPMIANRSELYRNGVRLTLLEEDIDVDAFDNRYQARLDVSNGQIELQAAYLVDNGVIGGDSLSYRFYTSGSANVGDGYIDNLTLVDLNAPTETWTVRCSSVQRDTNGDPVDGYARFTVRGSVSGILLDGYGNAVTWQSNDTLTSNGVLSFSISEGLTPFEIGDTLTIRVQSGALLKGDSLTIKYIAVTDLNDPEFFTDMVALSQKHGRPSETNRLSLAAQLAFSNSAPGVWAIQSKPAIPRRVQYTLVESANGEDEIEDLTFELPIGVTPDTDSQVNFFITDPVTAVTTQITPNKTAFYDPTITASPSSFVFGAGYTYAYTVIQSDEAVKTGLDGVLTAVSASVATLESDTVTFDLDDLSGSRTVEIVNATNAANNGVWTIDSVSGGVVTISGGGGFVTESDIEFLVLDTDGSSSRILFTDDLALTLGQALTCTVVDEDDAEFYDAGWAEAYEAAETIETDILIPVPSQTVSAIFQAGKAHVESMSTIKNKKERMLFIGGIAGLEPDNVTGVEDAAVEDIGILEGIQGDDASEVLAGNIEDLTNYDVQDAFGDSFRVMYFFPDEIVVQVGASRLAVDGMFMSAAAGGFFTGRADINTPLTNKSLGGFAILRSKLYTPSTLEALTSNGITVLQPVAGGGRVIWGKTTTTSGFAEEEEPSVVFIRDQIAKSLRGAFNGYIGIAETPTLQAELYSTAVDAANAFLSQRLITDYTDIVVKRDEVEQRQWNVTMAVQPVYPVNWIYVRVNLGIL